MSITQSDVCVCCEQQILSQKCQDFADQCRVRCLGETPTWAVLDVPQQCTAGSADVPVDRLITTLDPCALLRINCCVSACASV